MSLGTIINVFSILIGAGIGVALGHRLPSNISRTLTDALGLVVLVIGGLNLMALTDCFLRSSRQFRRNLVGSFGIFGFRQRPWFDAQD